MASGPAMRRTDPDAWGARALPPVQESSWPQGRARPAFFIAGAPRCGTTSLYVYLSANPRLFLTSPKEPRYFCSDLPRPLRQTRSLDAYAELYPPAEVGVICGEGTPWYLYSRVAVPAILGCNPDAKFIVMLRDPTEMAQSLYLKHVLAGIETAPTLEDAWAAQKAEHLADRGLEAAPIPSFPYAEVCALGRQLQRLYAQVPPHRVLLVFLDDLARDPAGMIRQVSSFLEVEPVLPSEFTPHNVGRDHRSERLRQGWSRVRQLAVYQALKRTANRFNLRPGRWLQERALTAPTRDQDRASPVLAEMRRHFRAEVHLLQELTGRSLRHWLPAPAASGT